MEEQIYNKENYKLHIIKTNRFKTITFDMKFTSIDNLSSLHKTYLLLDMLIYSCKKYNTKKLLTEKSQELYKVSYDTSYRTIGKYGVLSFTYNFINPKYTTKDMMEESLNLFKEIYFNPDIKDNLFNEEYFEMIKSKCKTNYELRKENPNFYLNNQFSKEMFKNTSYAYDNFLVPSLIEKTTNKEVVEEYYNLFKNHNIDIFVVGDVNEEEILSYFDNLLKNIKSKYEELSMPYITLNKRKELKEIKEKSSFNQSNIRIGYTFSSLTPREKNYCVDVLTTILGSMSNSILFVNVREKLSLCYHISSSYSLYTSSIIITSGFSSKNYEKVLKEVDNCIKKINDIKVIEASLENAKNTIITSLNSSNDKIGNIINESYFVSYNIREDIAKSKEEFLSVTAEEISTLSKKIKKEVIYFLEEENK
ncbi:MAG: insulinase family protein [Bacilli bacterium]